MRKSDPETVNRIGQKSDPGAFPPKGGDLRQKIHFWFTIAVMVLIFAHSAMPADLSAQESGVIVAFLMEHLKGLLGGNTKLTTFIVRKSAHFLEYTVLGFSLCLTTDDFEIIYEENKPADSSVQPALWGKSIPWLIGTAYAVTDEIHQSFVPGRSCEVRDVVIDSCGVAAGVLLCRIIKKWKKGQSH